MDNSNDTTDAARSAIVGAFLQARRDGASLAEFPGEIPHDLVAAYEVQDLAISQWPDQVVGWKVGYIAPDRRDASGDERLLGPIFARHFWNATGSSAPIPVFVGGFGAVEAEDKFDSIDTRVDADSFFNLPAADEEDEDDDDLSDIVDEPNKDDL